MAFSIKAEFNKIVRSRTQPHKVSIHYGLQFRRRIAGMRTDKLEPRDLMKPGGVLERLALAGWMGVWSPTERKIEEHRFSEDSDVGRHSQIE